MGNIALWYTFSSFKFFRFKGRQRQQAHKNIHKFTFISVMGFVGKFITHFYMSIKVYFLLKKNTNHSVTYSPLSFLSSFSEFYNPLFIEKLLFIGRNLNKVFLYCHILIAKHNIQVVTKRLKHVKTDAATSGENERYSNTSHLFFIFLTEDQTYM